MADDTEAKPQTPTIDPAQVAPGQIMSFTYYVEVVEVQDGGGTLIAKNLNAPPGTRPEIRFQGRSLVEHAASADIFTSTQKIGITAAEELLKTLYNHVLTICFVKKDATERVMRGRYIGPAPLARSWIEDLELPGGFDSRVRLADHRTLKWFVVDSVKYVIK